MTGEQAGLQFGDGGVGPGHAVDQPEHGTRAAVRHGGVAGDRPEAHAEIVRSEVLDVREALAQEGTVVAVQRGVVTGDRHVGELGEDAGLRAERRVDHLR